MKNNLVSSDPQPLSRRQFIKSSGAAIVTGALAANELIVPMFIQPGVMFCGWD